MNYTKNNLRINLVSIITVCITVIVSSCNQSRSNTISQNESTLSKDTLFIHNDENKGSLAWSFILDDKVIYPLQKGKEMILKIDFMGEYVHLKNQFSTHISSVDSNCVVTKVNNKTFKVLINNDFTSKILKLKVEGSPTENVTIINTQYNETYDYPTKFFMTELNNEVLDN